MGTAMAEGTEKWYPFMQVEHPRTMEEYLSDVRTMDARVSCDGVVERLRRQGVVFSSCDEFIETLRTKGELRPCDLTHASVPVGFGIERTNSNGTIFDVWGREGEPLCHPDEQFVWLYGRAILSTYCGNVLHWPTPKPVAEVPRTVWVEDPPVVTYDSGGIGVSIGVGSPYYGGGVYTGISLENGNSTTLHSGHLVTE